MADDPFRLRRFVDAQAEGGTYERALAELRSGSKRSHWVWFVLPQLAGLGRSPRARAFGIATLAEAKAYLAHPVLGPRLLECARALTAHTDRSAVQILGEVDAVKLRSSMTLFARADPGEPVFRQVLEQHYGGSEDEATARLLDGRSPDACYGE